MDQRARVLKIWERRRELFADSPRRRQVDAFFELVRQQTEICWEGLVDEVRRNYANVLDEIVAVLLDTDDPLILYNITRFADLNNPKEVTAVQQLIHGASGEKHQLTLRTLAETQKSELMPALREKPDLPESVRAALRPDRPPRRAKS
ncbi:MAG TPA: hypothetical protein VLK82_09550 [Candidatus Tectomicrobia bacterium]|nr:hypothetical protein [Candidatus Tectomicrobia bacterium]